MLEVNGLRAVRSVVAPEGRGASTTLDLTWIAHEGVVSRLVGVSPTPRYGAYRPLFDQVVSSFRALTPADLAQIRDARLRLVTAKAGERPEDLARRTGSVWSGEQIAVVNDLASDARLAAGQELKVALPEPYRNRR
jgi:predicted Zn-dependent protease